MDEKRSDDTDTEDEKREEYVRRYENTPDKKRLDEERRDKTVRDETNQEEIRQ